MLIYSILSHFDVFLTYINILFGVDTKCIFLLTYINSAYICHALSGAKS